MSEPEPTKPTYQELASTLKRLTADAFKLDDNALELLHYNLLQATEEVVYELRKRKVRQDN